MTADFKGKEYVCPTCGQPPGERCRSASGRIVDAYTHVARIRLREARLRGDEQPPPDEWRCP